MLTDETGSSIYNLQIYSQKGGIAFPRNARTYASYDPGEGIWMAFYEPIDEVAAESQGLR